MLREFRIAMSMNDSFVNIVDLPDEILLIILKKLNRFDVLYSLVGVNEKLDNVACDINFTRAVDLLTISSNGVNNSITHAILDRFCMHILPRIHKNVECLTVESCFLQRVLHASNYLNLRKLTLINLELSMASDIFNGMLLDFSMFKKVEQFLYILRKVSIHSYLETPNFRSSRNN